MGGMFLHPVVVFAQESTSATDPKNRPIAGYAMLMMILLLMIVVLVFGWFIMRSFQRSRKRMSRSRPEATDATDVWAMHKLPEDDDPDNLDDGADDDD
ncbi:MAG: hypothetical protein DHS20C16_31340 [Phycisphaerae bacterium]|nr:MAG: hypothetical protein DHS20C16_31340 [Phycisphaerae bacterium]